MFQHLPSVIQKRRSHGIQAIGGSTQERPGEKVQINSWEGLQPGAEDEVGHKYVERIKDMHMENSASRSDH